MQQNDKKSFAFPPGKTLKKSFFVNTSSIIQSYKKYMKKRCEHVICKMNIGDYHIWTLLQCSFQIHNLILIRMGLLTICNAFVTKSKFCR